MTVKRAFSLFVLVLVGIQCHLLARTDISIWNGRHGFDPFCMQGDIIRNDSCRNHYAMATNEVGNLDFVWENRLQAVNNGCGKQYPYIAIDGKQHKIPHPAYGLAIVSESSDTLLVQFNTLYGDYDELSGKGDCMSARLILRCNGSCQTLDSTILSRNKMDIYTGTNGIRLVRNGKIWQVCAGNHKMNRVLEAELDDFDVSQIGYMLAPAAAIRLKYIYLEFERPDIRYVEVQDLDSDTDPLAGHWIVSDFNLDTQLVRQGGVYDMWVQPADEPGVAYDMVYLSGAETNASLWQRGMVKCELKQTGIAGVYDAVWYDAEHRLLSNNVRAQASTDGNPYRYDVIAIRFPYQDSVITLRRVR